MRLAGLTLLIVEDDLDNLEVVASYLEAQGATVLGAGSIAGALAMTINRPISALLCELELPDGSGCNLLTQLRSRDGCKALPALAFTAHFEAEWRELAERGGFARHIVKPFSLVRLVDWILELTQVRGATGEAACHAGDVRGGPDLRRR
jgi:CheY-like chemotaxis protein